MKTIFVSAASAALVVAAAASPVMAQDSWTGGYVGAIAGYADVKDDGDEVINFDRDFDGAFDDTVVTGAGADAFGPGFCGGSAVGNNAGAGCDSDDSSGGEFGVRAGYDWQFGSWVVGGVAEYSSQDVEDNMTGFSVTPAAYQFERSLDSVAAIRARAGYVYGPALIYATAGYAMGKIDNGFTTTNMANSFTPTVDDDDADGWQAGGGVEYRLNQNISVTGEYLYTSLDAGDYIIRVGPGTAPPTNPFILPPNTAGTDMRRSNDEFEVHALRVGINYRF